MHRVCVLLCVFWIIIYCIVIVQYYCILYVQLSFIVNKKNCNFIHFNNFTDAAFIAPDMFSHWHGPNSETLGLKKKRSFFPSHNYVFVVSIMCIWLINTISHNYYFPTKLFLITRNGNMLLVKDLRILNNNLCVTSRKHTLLLYFVTIIIWLTSFIILLLLLFIHVTVRLCGFKGCLSSWVSDKRMSPFRGF